MLRKYTYEVISSIYFDCCDNIQVISKTPQPKREELKNAKRMWSSTGCMCSNAYLTEHLMDVSLKRKTDTISIIIRRMSTDVRAKAVGMQQQGAGIRQVSHFSQNTDYRKRTEYLNNYHRIRML